MAEKITTEYITRSRLRISSQVREFRKNNRLTQLELAKLVGVTRSAINKVEAGVWVSLEILIKIGAVLDFEVALIKK